MTVLDAERSDLELIEADDALRVVERGEGLVVVRRYAEGGAAAAHADHLALWRSSLGERRRPPGVPRPLALDTRRQEVSSAFVPGRVVATPRDAGRAWQHTADVARLLADLHACDVELSRRCDDAVLGRAAVQRADELRHPAGVRRRTREEAAVAVLALRLGDALVRRADPGADALVPSHGAFAPSSVVVAADGPVLVRLEHVQAARPERDLAAWGAWMWTAELLTGRDPSWFALSALHAEYVVALRAAEAPCRLDGLDVLAWHQAAALLDVAHGWRELAGRPDLRAAVLGEALRLLGQR